MSKASRRVLVVAAILALLLLLLLLWWKRPAPGFAIELVARQKAVGTGGKVELEARITPPEAASSTTLTWTASQGQLLGQGRQVVFVAPRDPGEVEITVSGVHGGSRRSASKRLKIIPYAIPSGTEYVAAPLQETLVGGYAIDDVKLDKTEFCQNETVRVSVKGHDPNGESDRLSAVVTLGDQRRLGSDVAISVGPGYVDKPQSFEQEVAVELTDTRYPRYVVATQRVKVKIKRCTTPDTGLWVICDGGGRDDTVVCNAQFATFIAPAPFQPVRWEWRVPTDPSGTYPIVTSGPFLHWPYPFPLPEQASFSHVFEVKAVGPEGQTSEGRASAAIANTFFKEKLDLSYLKLAVHYDAPSLVDGKEQIHVDLANPYQEAIALDRLEITRQACNGAAPPPLEKAAPAARLGTTTLQPGQHLRFTWAIPPVPESCGERVDVIGHGTDSLLEARGAWLLPTDPATRTVVEDAVEAERIRKAIEIIKKRDPNVQEVTEEDLAELEAEGLIPPRVGPAPAGPPPPADVTPAPPR